MDSRMIPRRIPRARQGAGHPRGSRRRAQYRRARHGREGIARIVIAGDRVLQGIEDFGAVGDRAAENAAAIAVDVRPDRAGEAEQRLVRQDERHGVVIGRSAAGARVSSSRLAITRLVLTDTPDPELEPSEAARVVS